MYVNKTNFRMKGFATEVKHNSTRNYSFFVISHISFLLQNVCRKYRYPMCELLCSFYYFVYPILILILPTCPEENL